MASSTQSNTSDFAFQLNKLICTRRLKRCPMPFGLIPNFTDMKIELIPLDEDGDWNTLDAKTLSLDEIMKEDNLKKVKMSKATHVVNVYEDQFGDYVQMYVK